MTTNQLNQAVQNGEAVALCTFWGARIESKMMRDSKSKDGAKKEGFIIHTTLMTETEPLVLQEFLKDGVDPKTWVAPAKRGDKVVARMRLGAGDFGRLQLLGVTVEKLDDVAAPAASVPSVKATR